METEGKTNSKKIAEALDLINEAAKEKTEEVREILASKYQGLKETLFGSDLKQSFGSARKSAVEAASRAKDVGEEKVKVLATQVDQDVHANPWQYIGGAALVSLLLGYILGRKN